MWATPSISSAETTQDRQRARHLFEQGMAAAEDEDYEGAIEALRESQEIYPLSGTLLNLALFQDRAGRRLEAHRSFSELIFRYGDEISGGARSQVNVRIRELDASLARVEVVTEPPGAMIRIDGEEQGTTPLPVPLVLEPGAYVVEARLDGFESEQETVDLSAGEMSRVELILSPRSEEPSNPRGSPSSEARRSFWRGPWPWIIGGIILAGSAAAVLGVTLSNDEPDPDWTLRVP